MLEHSGNALSDRIRAARDLLKDFAAGGTYTADAAQHAIGELQLWQAEAKNMENRLFSVFGHDHRPLAEGETFQAPMSEIARRYQRVDSQERAA
jgi:hypothetical protein